MALLQYLDSKKVRYELTKHRPAFTAQQIAAEEHVPGMQVAKPVLIKADDKYYLCVLPACYKIVFSALSQYLRADDIRLADEREMAEVFGGCQLGAEAPFGQLYGIETLMDEVLEKDVYITFQAESHEQAVRIRMADYKKLVCPRILSFSYHERS
jgi:Ala-tRNA(Pro) deacylase